MDLEKAEIPSDKVAMMEEFERRKRVRAITVSTNDSEVGRSVANPSINRQWGARILALIPSPLMPTKLVVGALRHRQSIDQQNLLAVFDKGVAKNDT